ncbi:hypothetical protein HC823_01340, partial [Candidatus Gracilibacteria bacterium]|nr:hypothetical protein [Candidatus Gracilibacteria bacterium]
MNGQESFFIAFFCLEITTKFELEFELKNTQKQGTLLQNPSFHARNLRAMKVHLYDYRGVTSAP